jgi:hypothetical protein
MNLYINKTRLVKQGANTLHLPRIGFQQENAARTKIKGRLRNDSSDKVQAIATAVKCKSGFPANFRGKVADFGGGNVGGVT